MRVSPAFELDHEKLAADPRLAELGAALSELWPSGSEESFNHYCREACQLWAGHFRRAIGETYAERLLRLW